MRKSRIGSKQVMRASAARRVIVTDADKDWLKVAKANL